MRNLRESIKKLKAGERISTLYDAIFSLFAAIELLKLVGF